jgi:hypothetical protein
MWMPLVQRIKPMLRLNTREPFTNRAETANNDAPGVFPIKHNRNFGP